MIHVDIVDKTMLNAKDPSPYNFTDLSDAWHVTGSLPGVRDGDNFLVILSLQ